MIENLPDPEQVEEFFDRMADEDIPERGPPGSDANLERSEAVREIYYDVFDYKEPPITER